MRYRHLSYAYTLVIQPSSVATQTVWRPPADVYETLGAITVTIELAGVDPEEMEVSLFENALVVEGGRRVPELDVGGIYHAAEIRRGPFRAEIALSAPVETQPIDMRCELGILSIRLAKALE